MKFYWAPRSRSFRVLWMLEEAGCTYERVLIDLTKGEQTTSDYKRINPMGKVPALEDNGTIVTESAAICAYIADKYPQAGLAPSLNDPARGPYLKWLFFAASCIEGALVEKFGQVQIPTSAAGWGDFDRVFHVLEDALTPGPWLLGDRFSAADVMIGTDLRFAITILNVVPRRPAFDTYLERCQARPAFQRAQRIDDAGS